MLRKGLLLAGLIGVLAVPLAQAGLQVRLQYAPNNPGTGGGEFTATPEPGTGWESYATFNTFCIEKGEFISLGSLYNVTIGHAAVEGGGLPPGAPAGSDPISLGTAWLFSQFTAGTLEDVDGIGYMSSANDQQDLQEAFWTLENETTTLPENSQNRFVLAAKDKLGTDASGYLSDANGEYGVMAMNLWNLDGSKAQSQLIMVPEPATVLAGALLLMPLGISAARIVRRKRNNQA